MKPHKTTEVVFRGWEFGYCVRVRIGSRTFNGVLHYKTDKSAERAAKEIAKSINGEFIGSKWARGEYA